MKNANGVFEYTTLSKDGRITLSGVKARNTNERTANEISFIVAIHQSEIRAKRSEIQSDGIQSRMEEVFSAPQSAVVGTRKVLCILIGFTDRAFSKTQTEFNNLMNQVGYNANSAIGSVKEYYLEASYGQLNLDVTVVGPYMANHNMAYYGADILDANGTRTGDIRPKELITEAVQKANPDVNYADYDSDGNGYVDGIHIIFAGYDQAANQWGLTDEIWSHKWQIFKIKLDNKWIQTYSCSSELRGDMGSTIATIGTACHEFGHVLGAPDLYDVDRATGGQFVGTGEWDLMAGGSWNGHWGARGSSPAHINPYTKINTFGWATAKSLPADNSLVTLYPANANSNSFYKIPTPTSGEYFLIENRQQLGFDAALPGHGMIAWHVHSQIESDRQAINTTHPQRLYPVCASTTQNPNSTPASYGTINGGGCPFPGWSNRHTLTFATTPSLRSWAGASTEKDIQFITENGNDVTFVVNPRISGPSNIYLQATYTIDNFPAGATVQWSMSPDFLSPSFIEQSANTILMINHYGKDGIGMQGMLNALITIGSQQISVSKPVLVGWTVASIEKSRLETRSGEYILEANTTQDENPDVTTTWSLSGPRGALVDFPYPDDAGYADKAGRLKVLEVYTPGYYTVCATANDGMYTTQEYCSTFYVEDYKANSPFFTLHPNPAANSSVSVRLAEEVTLLESNQLKPQALTSSIPYTIQLWNSFGLVRQVTADKTTYQLDLTGVPPGFYYVHVIKDGLTYRRQLVVQ